MQALENSRLFYFGDMEELYWNEVGLERDSSRLTGDPGSLMITSQKRKATSLRDTIYQRLERGVRPADLEAFGEPGSSNPSIPTPLNLGDEPPDFQEESVWTMAEISEAHLEEGQSIIFVDWTRCYDNLFIVAYNGTKGRIKTGLVEIDYHIIEEWVHRELGVSSLHQGRTDRRRLHRFTPLKKLTPILETLEGFVKPKDLLILCPSGILHAVPLQAIPFGPKGQPLIASNPVVFCPSLSLLQTCVNNVKTSSVLKSIPTAAFTRLGPGDAKEQSRMYRTAQDGLNDKLLQTSFASETEVTRDLFINQSRGARLLHYHGHAYLEADQRRDRALQLEPRLATADLPWDDGLLSVMEIFDLQLDSAVVVLLACASGEDDVAPNDDPLGLLSAFLYAGASSIIATRWPTQTSDAREFAKSFYEKVFSSRKDGIVNLAVAVQGAVLELWDNWDEDDPYHWAQFQLCKSRRNFKCGLRLTNCL
jgi:CHAT domain-containing protein